ncbi:PIN domain-containing protein [Caldiplasma sukawensis]
MKYLPDTSVIVDGRFSNFMEKIESGSMIFIPEPVLGEIEYQANQNRSMGYAALNELNYIRKKANLRSISIAFVGKRMDYGELKFGKLGSVDSEIRNLAMEYDAVLVTGDRVQAEIARIKNIETVYLEPEKKSSMKIEDFFKEETMSVHLSEGCKVRLKNGSPGNISLVEEEKVMDYVELENLANDIIRRAGNEPFSFIEMDSDGATVIQLGKYRIVITRPPFSTKLEITAVRQIKNLSLEDYNIDNSIIKDIISGSTGILVAGAPGAGKSTFVQALANYLDSMGLIVKTMERPRDLQVVQTITQYTSLDGSMEKTGDILLLVRNDYTIFDEMRVTSDFKVFSDLRLAGVGMIGVVHATKPIDAIQRFIGRIELGVIPQVINRILYINGGEVRKILSLRYSIKVPEGMAKEDLARPVIEAVDWGTSKVEYEIYSFGEQIVVVPLKENMEKMENAKKRVEDYLNERYKGKKIKFEIKNGRRGKISVPEYLKGKMIGKSGKNISNLEELAGVPIDVESVGEETKFPAEIEARNNIYYVQTGEPGKLCKLYADDLMILQGMTSSKGIIRVKINSDVGKTIERAILAGKKISYSIA